MKKFQIILSIASATILFSGCASSFGLTQEKEPVEKANKVVSKDTPSQIFSAKRIIPYNKIINMGQYAEAWIAPYKDDDGNLFNERRMNFWVIEPSFVDGEELPRKKDRLKENKKQIFNVNKATVNNQATKKIVLDKNILEYLEKKK